MGTEILDFDGARPRPGNESTASVLSGSARDVVQARDVHGGVHFHAAREPGPERFPVPRQLPGAVPRLIGRAEHLVRLRAVAERSEQGGPGIGVIVGAAGSGKTALAVRFAHEVRACFPDGQLFVDLRGHSPDPPLAPDAVLGRFLRALGTAAADLPHGLEERSELYRSLSADRAMIVVLDNVATAGQVRPLLPGAGPSLVLATSRSRVSALSAFLGASRISLDRFDAEESVALLRESLEDSRAAASPEALAELAVLCAGLPLALRIAAERAASRPQMSLRVLVAELKEESTPLDVLSADAGDEPDALRPVFAWSYRHLPDLAARAFRLLGLHPGPAFGQESAGAITGLAQDALRAALDTLVGVHLLEETEPGRYRLHDLLRAYAAETAGKDESAENRRAALERVATFYLGTADHAVKSTAWDGFAAIRADEPTEAGAEAETEAGTAAEPAARPDAVFADAAEADRWYEAEKANLADLARIADLEHLDEILWKLPVTLEQLFSAHSDTENWISTARHGLVAARRLADPAAEAAVRQTLGAALKAAGDYEAAAGQHREALDLYQALGDQDGILRALNRLALANLMRRAFPEAAEGFQRALALSGQRGSGPAVAAGLAANLADCELDTGHPDRALAWIDQELSLLEQAGAGARRRAPALMRRARVHAALGDLAAVEADLAACDGLLAELPYPGHLGTRLLLARADLHRQQARTAEAIEDYRRCLDPAIAVDVPILVGAAARAGLGDTLRAVGDPGQALAYQQEAVALQRRRAVPFELATALRGLADTLDDLGENGPAAEARAEALSLIEPFADLPTRELRDLLTGPKSA